MSTNREFHFGVAVTTLHNVAVEADDLDAAVLAFDSWLRKESTESYPMQIVKREINIIGVGQIEDGKMVPAGTISDETEKELASRPEIGASTAFGASDTVH